MNSTKTLLILLWWWQSVNEWQALSGRPFLVVIILSKLTYYHKQSNMSFQIFWVTFKMVACVIIRSYSYTMMVFEFNITVNLRIACCKACVTWTLNINVSTFPFFSFRKIWEGRHFVIRYPTPLHYSETRQKKIGFQFYSNEPNSNSGTGSIWKDMNTCHEALQFCGQRVFN